MASFLKLQLLGVVQGLAEFLPVSSSGHLALLKNAFGLDSGGGNGPLLEVLLHLGTLIALLVFYRKRLVELACGVFRRDPESLRYCLAVAVSCLPAALLYFLAHDAIERCFGAPVVVSCLLLFTGFILLSLRKAPSAIAVGSRQPGWLKAVMIGCAQAMAMLPGISRSGSTYCAARWLKVGSKDAFDFSFLMSIPVIAGAVVLKARHFRELSECGSPVSLVCAAAVAGIVGYFALKALSLIRIAGRFWYFSFWCLAAGLVSLAIAVFT